MALAIGVTPFCASDAQAANQLVIARRHGDAVRLQHVGVDIQALPVQTNRRKQHASVAFRHRGHLFRTAVRRGGEQFIHADQLIRRQSAAQRHNDDIRPAGGHHLLHLLHEHVVLKPGIILHEIARLIFPGGDQIHVALCGKIHIRQTGVNVVTVVPAASAENETSARHANSIKPETILRIVKKPPS